MNNYAVYYKIMKPKNTAQISADENLCRYSVICVLIQ